MRKRLFVIPFIVLAAIMMDSCQKEDGTDIPAALVDGPTFNAAIPNDATAVVFEYNSKVSSGKLLSTADSPVPIYGNLDGTTWKVSTNSKRINANPNCKNMFRARWNEDLQAVSPNLQTIKFGEGFNTENVTDMSSMFDACTSLTRLDLSTFNTSNVTNMSFMFIACEKLTNLDISSFNTKNVTDMSGMFSSCWSLTSIDVQHFNTRNVTYMSFMFSECISLSSLNVSSFNTENVTDMCSMFQGCNSLSRLDLSHFNTKNVTNMNYMFNYCYNLESLDLSNWNTSSVTGMHYMFYDCDSIT